MQQVWKQLTHLASQHWTTFTSINSDKMHLKGCIGFSTSYRDLEIIQSNLETLVKISEPQHLMSNGSCRISETSSFFTSRTRVTSLVDLRVQRTEKGRISVSFHVPTLDQQVLASTQPDALPLRYDIILAPIKMPVHISESVQSQFLSQQCLLCRWEMQALVL